MQSHPYQNSENNQEQYYLLGLINNSNLIFRLGRKLFELFPEIEELFAVGTDWSKLNLSTDEITKLKNPNWCLVERDLRWAEEPDHHIITIHHADYPDLLKEIQNPPLLLFAIGDLSLLKSSQIAMVGSRHPTPLGIETATNFAHSLVEVGLVVTSGLAFGIDAASHRGAIAGLGKTIAVMGTGLNLIYPQAHTQLAKQIVAAGGLLLSEFSLTASGNAWHFPLRNRVISGLTIGTLIVEATIRSGSLITARFAAEQGREVFAIPGSIYSASSRGCHYLIRQGAKLVEQPTDILEEFPALIKTINSQTLAGKNKERKNKLDWEHRKLLDCVGFSIVTVDILAVRASLSASRVTVMLLELELQGWIKTVAAGYIRI